MCISSVFLLPYDFPIHADRRMIKREPAGVGSVGTCRLASAGNAGIMECSQRRLRSARMRETVDLKYPKGTRRYT